MSGQAIFKPALELSLNKRLTMSFQQIPVGSFRMGSRGEYPDEEPIHVVQITKPFYLGTFAVTQAQFAVWTRAANIEHENQFQGQPNHPAESMDWDQAAAYCHWLNETLGRKLPSGYLARLPTEAQWEYACRAGTETEYYTGDGAAALAEAGWFNENSGNETHPVGQLAPNNFGLYDMHGNVDDWCQDAWDTDAYKKRADGAADPEVRAADVGEENPYRVFRGGSWRDSARNCRSAVRYRWWPVIRDWDQGFRVCLVPGPVPQQQFRGTES